MKQRSILVTLLLCVLLLTAASALAAGTTVTTFTPFADMDFAFAGIAGRTAGSSGTEALTAELIF